MACLRHFQAEPLSVLVPAAAERPEALAHACEALPAALRGSIEGRNARKSMGKVVTAWTAWAVSVHWLHEAAQSLGMGHSAGPISSSILLACCSWGLCYRAVLQQACTPSHEPHRQIKGLHAPMAQSSPQVDMASRSHLCTWMHQIRHT